MKILRIDPGLNTTGYGLIEASGKRARLVEAVLKLTRSASVDLHPLTNWLPRRFSIGGMLLLTLALSCLLAWRLQPLYDARRFERERNAMTTEEVLALLQPDERGKNARHQFEIGPGRVTDSPWQVLWAGKCHVEYDANWSEHIPQHPLLEGKCSGPLLVEFSTSRDPAARLMPYVWGASISFFR
ncbi:hypothetical protein [Aeoliella sp. SH292]|uniref:hypothetical protein n=1 Tax=Aeoliella sp. SH292 TaxID=3454464 RepID=UPI003F98D729